MAEEMRDYEVHEKYKNFSVEQLTHAPITCFQGVSEQNAILLKQYFKVEKVADMANLGCFKQAMAVQKVLSEDTANPDESVDKAQSAGNLGFKVRAAHTGLSMKDLLQAPVHVLDDITPSQDLALYNTFRITNLKQLAENHIMLEAHIIAVLHEKGGNASSAEVGGAGDMEGHVQSRITAMSARIQAQDAVQARRSRQKPAESASSRAANIAQRRSAGGGSRLGSIMASRDRARTVRDTAMQEGGKKEGTSAKSVAAKTLKATETAASAAVTGKEKAAKKTKKKRSRLTPAARILIAACVLGLLALVVWGIVAAVSEEPVPAVVEPPPPSPPPQRQTLRVAEGESLWQISERELKDPERWTEIFDANRESIKNPHLVYPNQEITLPVNPDALPPSQESAPPAAESQESAPPAAESQESAPPAAGGAQKSPY